MLNQRQSPERRAAALDLADRPGVSGGDGRDIVQLAIADFGAWHDLPLRSVPVLDHRKVADGLRIAHSPRIPRREGRDGVELPSTDRWRRDNSPRWNTGGHEVP